MSLLTNEKNKEKKGLVHAMPSQRDPTHQHQSRFSSILLTHFLQVIAELLVPVERILVFSVLVDFTSGLLSLGFHFTFGKDCRKERKRAIVVMDKNHLCTPLTEHFFLASFSACTNWFASLVFHVVGL